MKKKRKKRKQEAHVYIRFPNSFHYFYLQLLSHLTTNSGILGTQLMLHNKVEWLALELKFVCNLSLLSTSFLFLFLFLFLILLFSGLSGMILLRYLYSHNRGIRIACFPSSLSFTYKEKIEKKQEQKEKGKEKLAIVKGQKIEILLFHMI